MNRFLGNAPAASLFPGALPEIGTVSPIKICKNLNKKLYRIFQLGGNFQKGKHR